MDPAPVTIRAKWPAHRRLVTDMALGGAAAGGVVGNLVFGRVGLIGLVVGALAGAFAAQLLGPRRWRLVLDGDGVTVVRLVGKVHIPWVEVVAFGIEDGWQGRRGVTAALAVARRGDEWPVTVPALAYHASGFRIGAVRPEQQLAPYRSQLLEHVRAWAEAYDVMLVDGDIDDWWDRNRHLLNR